MLLGSLVYLTVFSWPSLVFSDLTYAFALGKISNKVLKKRASRKKLLTKYQYQATSIGWLWFEQVQVDLWKRWYLWSFLLWHSEWNRSTCRIQNVN